LTNDCFEFSFAPAAASQALSAGVPQLVVPRDFDQFDNAERVERMGVGLSIPAKRYRAKEAATALTNLTRSPDSFQRRCQTISKDYFPSSTNRRRHTIEDADAASALSASSRVMLSTSSSRGNKPRGGDKIRVPFAVKTTDNQATTISTVGVDGVGLGEETTGISNNVNSGSSARAANETDAANKSVANEAANEAAANETATNEAANETAANEIDTTQAGAKDGYEQAPGSSSLLQPPTIRETCQHCADDNYAAACRVIDEMMMQQQSVVVFGKKSAAARVKR
jgi:hypothetical protein